MLAYSGVGSTDSAQAESFSLHVSPRGEAKWVRGSSGRGASRLARAGVLEQYVEARQASATKSWRAYRVLRPSGGETCRLRFNGRQTFLLERTRPPPMFFTKHETRNTAFFRNTAFSVARMVHVGTEALQSCFFRPGLLGNSTERGSPCGSRIRASQAFTSRKPLIVRSLRNTNHETRVTAFMFFTNHETRNTTHSFVFFTNYESRNMVSMVLVGTEALQSFFSR